MAAAKIAAAKKERVRVLRPPARSADWWRLAHDPATVSRRAREAARRLGLRRTVLFREGQDVVELLQSPAASAKQDRPRVYLSAGIHGDEPGGVEGLLRWMESPAARAAARRFHLTIVPCVNPSGLRANRRADAAGRDLNRCFDKRPPVIAALRRLCVRPFDLGLLLHEDYDGCGIYLYELGSGGARWGHRLLRAARPYCPPDPSRTIESFPCDRGVIYRDASALFFRAFFAQIGLPEGPYLYLQGTRRVFTVETPSEFDLAVRAEAHRAVIDAALELLAKERKA
ncbi:MAG: M14 family metallocarboxypeptidase [Verrucomicrobium sp.]|nr:M14 family metallocarboxypeptidase [Verrucomicrobium sp.]